VVVDQLCTDQTKRPGTISKHKWINLEMITYQMIASKTKRKKESQDCVELQATSLSSHCFFFFTFRDDNTTPS
jgi:hypothetical protein